VYQQESDLPPATFAIVFVTIVREEAPTIAIASELRGGDGGLNFADERVACK
jgi:hypothetical protein